MLIHKSYVDEESRKIICPPTYIKAQRGDRTETWSECRTGSENVNNRLASNKCDNSQSFLIKIFFERFWKVGLKANIVRLIHNYK